MSIVSDIVSALSGDPAPLTLSVEGLSEASRVIRFKGREEMSALYEFSVVFAAGELELDKLVGRAATLQLDGVGPPRFVYGIIASVEYIGDSRRYQLYELTLVPRAWRLLHRRSSRIFQNRTTAEVVAAVFKDAGPTKDDVRFELTAAYAPRNYCVQYRESDLAFVSRLLEEDGIFYFFEHGEVHATMVISDHTAVLPTIAGEQVVWFHDSGQLRDREHVSALRVVERVRPGKVSLRDFNFHKPTQKTEADASARRDADLEVYDYPGEFQDRNADGSHQGQSLAKIRLEELQATRRQASGSSDCMRLVPGHLFAIAGHRRVRADQRVAGGARGRHGHQSDLPRGAAPRVRDLHRIVEGIHRRRSSGTDVRHHQALLAAAAEDLEAEPCGRQGDRGGRRGDAGDALRRDGGAGGGRRRRWDRRRDRRGSRGRVGPRAGGKHGCGAARHGRGVTGVREHAAGGNRL